MEVRSYGCLLYTSDAADERSSVDLGGRRIIKKKKREKKKKKQTKKTKSTIAYHLRSRSSQQGLYIKYK